MNHVRWLAAMTVLAFLSTSEAHAQCSGGRGGGSMSGSSLALTPSMNSASTAAIQAMRAQMAYQNQAIMAVRQQQMMREQQQMYAARAEYAQQFAEAQAQQAATTLAQRRARAEANRAARSERTAELAARLRNQTNSTTFVSTKAR